MIVTAKILQGEGKKLVVLPDKDISRYLAQKRPSWVEIRLNDGRTISAASICIFASQTAAAPSAISRQRCTM